MPHLSIEYTNNLPGFDAGVCLAEINAALAASGHFDECDIKSRAFPVSEFRIGTNPLGRAFVSVELSILSGRSLEVRQELSACVLECLARRMSNRSGLHVQLSVEVLEIERASYAKAVVGN